jgi:hypothetical protein
MTWVAPSLPSRAFDRPGEFVQERPRTACGGLGGGHTPRAVPEQGVADDGGMQFGVGSSGRIPQNLEREPVPRLRLQLQRRHQTRSRSSVTPRG